MNKIPLALIAIIAFAIILLFSGIKTTNKIINYYGNEPSEEEKFFSPADNENPEENQNSNPANTDSSEGSSEDSSETSEQTSPTTPSCSLQQISYSLKNSQTTQTCSTYQEEICVDKTVECSLKVTNLDFETTGLFEIQFNLIEGESTIESASDSHVISPKNFKIFSTTFNIQGETADKDFHCSFNKLQIPEKEVC
ncbi:MAG: hypothetical protein KJ600_03715 [Nanoarchaeota archaeon]|nr:hypothetical protein [Nanoarchaeota archaeon]MBU1103635.1 hypothetical protein [Nanoarchaeota archaeon]